MKLLIAGLLAASTIAVAAPAAAQVIYIGPRGGGVGVGVGADPYYGGGYDRDGYDEPYYQGRSVHRDPYDTNDFDDDF